MKANTALVTSFICSSQANCLYRLVEVLEECGHRVFKRKEKEMSRVNIELFFVLFILKNFSVKKLCI
jgi:hypothetical protein